MCDLMQEKKDEMRRDMLEEEKMRGDIEYFTEKVYIYEQLIDVLSRMKSVCSVYDHDLDDVLAMARDEI